MGKDEKKDGEMIQVPVRQREREGQRKADGGNAALYSAGQRRDGRQRANIPADGRENVFV